MLEQYDKVIKDQNQQGIVKPAPDTGSLCHYLPHHAVIQNDKKTTKLRIVYDAPARMRDRPSLNKGPELNQCILDILLRFRGFRVPLTADLEKAFLQVSIAEADKDVLRFLWIEGISREDPAVSALRFTRVVFGASASPFLLNATLSHHFQKYLSTHPVLVQRLLQSKYMYVNNVISGADTKNETFAFYEQSKKIFYDVVFNL